MPPKPLFILTLLLLPALASAAFVPLVSIPGINANASFNDYINALYALSISIAALIAVIKIIIAGVKWMLTDIVSSKQEAKSDIQGALLGLLLIIAAVLILEVINPQLKSSSLFLGKVDTVKRAPAVGGGEGSTTPLKNWDFNKDVCPDNKNNTSGCQALRANCAVGHGKVIDEKYRTTCSYDVAVDSGVSPMNPGVGGGGGEGGMIVGGKFTDGNFFPDGTEIPWHLTETNDKIDVINKAFPTRAPNLNDDDEWYFVWRILNGVPASHANDGKTYATRIMEESDCKTCFKHPEDYINQINAVRTNGGSTGGNYTGDLSGSDYGNPAISAVSSAPVTQGGVTITTMAPATISGGVAHLQALVKPGTMSVFSVYGTSENNLDQKSSFVFSYAAGTSAAMIQEANTSYEKQLTPNTIYYYKVCAINEARTITPVCGNLMKFKTVP